VSKYIDMNWKDFFRLNVQRETLEGSQMYFQSELRTPELFSMEELMLREFEYLGLSNQEKKNFSLNLRKIWLRHHYFKSAEFDRIVENFIERLSHEKDQLITFSTKGGGIYLFGALLRKEPGFLKEKKLICYTSEIPLLSFQESVLKNHIHFILRPGPGRYFHYFPTLWQQSCLIDLSSTLEA
jgi:hypothetical protein